MKLCQWDPNTHFPYVCGALPLSCHSLCLWHTCICVLNLALEVLASAIHGQGKANIEQQM